MKSMKSILGAHPDFELKVNNKLITLIKVIHNMMNETVRYQYPLVEIIDALNQLTNIKQFETESLIDYVAR